MPYSGGGGAATSVSAAAFPLRGPADTAAAPNYSFSGDPDTGLFSNGGGNQWGLSAGGIVNLGFVNGGGSNRIGIAGIPLGLGATLGSEDIYLRRRAAGVFGVTSDQGGTAAGWIQNEAGDQFLTANHTNATATPTNLTDLTVNVTSGHKYSFDMILMCSQSVAADGIRIDFEGGTATATNFRANVLIFDGVTLDTHTSVTALATDVTSTDVGTTVLVEAHGSFEPSSTGTFIPRVGLEAASTGTITTFRGSYLLIKDMP